MLSQRPLLIDLETRSACDLRACGGWNYATHTTTRLLTVAWSPEPEEYHVWLRSDRLPPQSYLGVHLDGVTVHAGLAVPVALTSLTNRVWAAHNAWTFDEVVWRQLTGGKADPVDWIDTYPLALSVGLPGGLKAIGHRLWGEGKYEEGSAVLKRVSRNVTKPVGPGELCMIAKYNVQDVRLLSWLWDEVQASLLTTEHEQRVLQCSRSMNERGVRVDRVMLRALVGLTEQSKAGAIAAISKLTDGFLSSQTDLQSRAKVFKWLDRMGVNIGSSLRKEIVQQFIDNNPGEDEDEAVSAGPTNGDNVDGGAPDVVPNLGRVVQVLSLRSNALRITGGKLTAAAQAVCSDDRVRGITVYHGAGTGRDAGRRINLLNLPRPKESVDVWSLIGLMEKLKGHLPIGAVEKNLEDSLARVQLKKPDATLSTPDDAASALIRSMFVGDCLGAADYSAIEARVLAWLAGERWLMEAFEADQDIYMAMAARIYGERPKDKKDPRRQVGKVVELAAGYGQGANGFAIYAAAQGCDLASAGTSPQECITAYRSAHPAIAGVQAGEYEGVPYFRGGYWDQLNAVALTAVVSGVPAVVGRVMFFMRRGHLYVRLPSGRHLMYRNAKAEETVTDYGKRVLSVVYLSHRYGPVPMYGGKWCWAEGTPVLTNRGVVPIESVVAGDRVWDGEAWVTTDGATFNGYREVGSWLGVRVTADHLIHDGRSWNAVTDLGDALTRLALKWGHDSISPPSFVAGLERGPSPSVSAPAAGSAASKRGVFSGSRGCPARRVVMVGQGSVIGCEGDSPSSYPTTSSGRCGSIGTPAWYPGVPTRTTKHTPTTGAGASPCTPTGSLTERCFYDTSLPFPDGIRSVSTWTGRITTEDTARGTSVWSPDQSTRGTGVRVYDLLNCGPRHAYTVVTDRGPVIAHNCENIVQAVARDIMKVAHVRMEDAGIRVVIPVYDELVAELSGRDQYPRFMECMTTLPEWADGFILDAEGGVAPRYAKSPPPGVKEEVWRNGRYHKPA